MYLFTDISTNKNIFNKYFITSFYLKAKRILSKLSTNMYTDFIDILNQAKYVTILKSRVCQIPPKKQGSTRF